MYKTSLWQRYSKFDLKLYMHVLQVTHLNKTRAFKLSYMYVQYTYLLWHGGAGMAQWQAESLASHQLMWPGFDSGPEPYVGRISCWLSSFLRGFFSGFSGFPPSTKTNTSKFQFDLESVRSRRSSHFVEDPTENSHYYYYYYCIF